MSLIISPSQFAALLMALFTVAPLDAFASCKEDATTAAKACLTKDLEAGMEGNDASDAQRTLSEYEATIQEIESGRIRRLGELHKVMAVQNKRLSILSAMKGRACAKSFKACSKSCESDTSPKAKEYAAKCKEIGSGNAKQAEEQAAKLMDNMKQSEDGFKANALNVETPERKSSDSKCYDKFTSKECVKDSGAGSAASGAGLALTEDSQNGTTSSSASAASGSNGGFGSSTGSGIGETAAGSGEMLTGRGVSGAAPVIRGLNIGSNSSSSFHRGSGETVKSETRAGKALAAIKAQKKAIEARDGSGYLNSSFQETSPEQPEETRAPVGGMSALRRDGVTGPMGMSLFEKIRRSYEAQKSVMIQD